MDTAAGMYAELPYITLYWLSGFGDPKYEIWESKKASIAATPEELSFTVYLAFPLEVAEDCRIVIRRRDGGLVLATDWFPDEEFELQAFASQGTGSVMLQSKYLREVFFIHLRKEYE
ncbi:MAG: hypothetical protein ACOZF2_05545 [Thermodesulfobacteriota bacterium]